MRARPRSAPRPHTTDARTFQAPPAAYPRPPLWPGACPGPQGFSGAYRRGAPGPLGALAARKKHKGYENVAIPRPAGRKNPKNLAHFSGEAGKMGQIFRIFSASRPGNGDVFVCFVLFFGPRAPGSLVLTMRKSENPKIRLKSRVTRLFNHAPTFGRGPITSSVQPF